MSQRFIAKVTSRQRRHRRVRADVCGTAEHPRLSVFRSAHHLVVQLIDDTAGVTLAAASDQEARSKADSSGKVATAHEVGKLIATRAKAKGIIKVVFDRGGYAYHGRVKAVAEGAREGGLVF